MLKKEVRRGLTYEAWKEEPIVVRCHDRSLHAQLAGSIVGAVDCPVRLQDGTPSVFIANKYSTGTYPELV